MLSIGSFFERKALDLEKLGCASSPSIVQQTTPFVDNLERTPVRSPTEKLKRLNSSAPA